MTLRYSEFEQRHKGMWKWAMGKPGWFYQAEKTTPKSFEGETCLWCSKRVSVAGIEWQSRDLEDDVVRGSRSARSARTVLTMVSFLPLIWLKRKTLLELMLGVTWSDLSFLKDHCDCENGNKKTIEDAFAIVPIR